MDGLWLAVAAIGGALGVLLALRVASQERRRGRVLDSVPDVHADDTTELSRLVDDAEKYFGVGDPQTAQPLLDLGSASYVRGDLAHAIDTLTRSAAAASKSEWLHPVAITALETLARAEARVGRYRRARAALRRAEALGAHDPWHQRNVAQVELDAGNPRGAAEVLRQLLASAQDHQTLGEGPYRTSDSFAEADAGDAFWAAVHLLYADALYAVGEATDAHAHQERGLRGLAETDGGATVVQWLLYLAERRYAQGMDDEVVQLLERVIALDSTGGSASDQSDAYSLLARAQTRGGQAAEARDSLRRAIEALGDSQPRRAAELHRRLARHELRAGNGMVAERHFSLAEALDPHGDPIAADAFELALSEGDHGHAEELMTANLVALRRDSDLLPGARYLRAVRLADALRRIGRTDAAREAKATAAEVLQNEPGSCDPAVYAILAAYDAAFDGDFEAGDVAVGDLKRLGADPSVTEHAAAWLALVRGHFAPAAEGYRAAADAMGPLTDFDTRASAVCGLAWALREVGDLARAEEALNEASTLIAHLRDAHSRRMYIAAVGALIASDRGAHDDALSRIVVAIDLAAHVSGAAGLDYAARIGERAELLVGAREWGLAAESATEAIGLLEHAWADDHPLVGRALHARAQARVEVGDRDAARRDLQQALAIFERVEHDHCETVRQRLERL